VLSPLGCGAWRVERSVPVIRLKVVQWSGVCHGGATVNTPPDLSAARVLYCPTCGAVAAKAETVGPTVVSLRCVACGEAWSIFERRRVSRQPPPFSRFPLW
jgi:hypothetical protein